MTCCIEGSTLFSLLLLLLPVMLFLSVFKSLFLVCSELDVIVCKQLFLIFNEEFQTFLCDCSVCQRDTSGQLGLHILAVKDIGDVNLTLCLVIRCQCCGNKGYLIFVTF